MESKVTLADQCAINIAAYLYYIEVKSKARLLDTAIISESFVRGLVATVFDHEKLCNLNLNNENYPAVDIATENGDIAFQVTISGGSEKIESTLETFMKNNLDQKYKRLVFIILGEKQSSYTSKKITKNAGTFNFDVDKDIYDLRQLYSLLINGAKPEKLQEKLQALRDLLASELGSNVSKLLIGYKRTEDNLDCLFSAHDVTPTRGASAMQRFGIDRPTFCHIDRLNACLTHEMVEYLAEEFSVSDEWITGEACHIYNGMPYGIASTDWRRNLRSAYELVDKYHKEGHKISVVMPMHLSIDDFETPYSEAEDEKIAANKDGNPVELVPHYLIVARSQNTFGVERYRWLANEPLQYSKIGVYLLFLAAEIWRHVHESSLLVEVQFVDYWDIRKVQCGELLLVDILRSIGVMRNHADYIYISKGNFVASNVSTTYIQKLQDDLKCFAQPISPSRQMGNILRQFSAMSILP
nr:SMEK domain-containing protein [uncultured Comamonas sp.]